MNTTIKETLLAQALTVSESARQKLESDNARLRGALEAAMKDAKRWRYRVTVELTDRAAEERRVDAALKVKG